MTDIISQMTAWFSAADSRQVTLLFVGILLWNFHHHHQVSFVGNTILLKNDLCLPTSDENTQLSAPFSLPPPHTYDYISLFQHSSSLQYALFWCRYAKYVF